MESRLLFVPAGVEELSATKLKGITDFQSVLKRAFDLSLAVSSLILISWLIALLAVLSTIDTGKFGIYRQNRLGRFRKPFSIFKIRTMLPGSDADSTVTVKGDPRTTKFGRFLRRTKLDELPQLLNIVLGQMSFVGPRPDVAAAYKCVSDHQRRVFDVRPGLTGPATLMFRDEEAILADREDPENYSTSVLMPMKVSINLHYIDNYRFLDDIKILFASMSPTASGSQLRLPST